MLSLIVCSEVEVSLIVFGIWKLFYTWKSNLLHLGDVWGTKMFFGNFDRGNTFPVNPSSRIETTQQLRVQIVSI